jgi:hypothetical protein
MENKKPKYSKSEVKAEDKKLNEGKGILTILDNNIVWQQIAHYFDLPIMI